MLRAVLMLSLSVGIAAVSQAQPGAKGAKPPLLSELAKPKAGEKLKVERAAQGLGSEKHPGPIRRAAMRA